jgi:metallo-beta-lactamase family protein
MPLGRQTAGIHRKEEDFMAMRLQFFGAAQNVTGSSYLVEAAGRRMLVDCGLYQERDFRARNWDPFPFDPGSLDAVLLTHAHADHCGLLPKLVRDGFGGRIHCSGPTAEIAGIVMLDSAKIQEEDVAYKRKRHEQEGREGPYPLEPLYTREDAEKCIERLTPLRNGDSVSLGEGLSASFHVAGHILGASMIMLQAEGEKRSILFSGDVGRWGMPLLRDPTCFDAADYVVCESTYGDRLHDPVDTVSEKLARVVNNTHRAGGKIVIPAFAVERTQELLYRLSELLRAGRIPRLPIFVDSPMAINVTEVFKRHSDAFDEETAARLRKGDNPCDFPGLRMSHSVEDSKAINDQEGSAIVIAGSGMCVGGRIKHHLSHNITRPESTVLFVGYQAVGTLGRVLIEKAPEVRIFNRMLPVRARIAKINGFSGHADRDELFRWLSALKQPPRRLFVTHGEARVSQRFADWVHAQTDWPVTVPAYQDTVELD